MGNRFVISIDDETEDLAFQKIDAAVEEIKRIERLFTTFSEDSITNQINASAGVQPVSVPDEFFGLVSRAQKISELTDGAFDLSYGSLDKKLWNFDQSGSFESRLKGFFPSFSRRGLYLQRCQYPHSTAIFASSCDLPIPALSPWLIHGA